MSIFKNAFIIVLVVCFFSCKKEEKTEIIDAPPFATAGTNQDNIEDFQVTLNADSLKSGQSGKWTVGKGLTESKVFFSDYTKPDSKFNGMPGETYQLKWTVTAGSKIFSESIVNITFKPLQAIIENISPLNKTKFNLVGNKYDKGVWSIEGKYAQLNNQIYGGTEIPTINSPSIEFQGYAHTKYKITWTTYYGSKSASATLDFTTGDYLEDEALEDLQLDKSSSRVVYDNGHITELHLNASGIAWILQDTLQYPALQALVYLKRLELRGSATFRFPTIIGDKYLQLEYLNMEDTDIGSIADNIGNLKKLKTLIITHSQHNSKIPSLPESIGNLESLEYLDLAAISLEYIPESFSKLEHLKYFNFQLNPVLKLPDNLGNMKKLEYLVGSTEQDIPASVSKLINLRRLQISNTAVNPKLPADIGKLKALDTLRIVGDYKELPASFTNLTNLRFLEMSTPPLASIPEDFGKLKKLSHLQIGGLLKTFPDSFTDLANLETLITGGSLEYFPKQFGKLKKLSTLLCEFGNLKALPETFGQLESLEDLRLRSNAITSIPSSFFDLPKLRSVNLSYNKISIISDDFSKLSGTLKQFYFNGNNYTAADGIRLKGLLPWTQLYVN